MCGVLANDTLSELLRRDGVFEWRSCGGAVRIEYLIFDRDQKFGIEVIAAVKATRIFPKRNLFRNPWQNGIAERWVGSCRRDLLDHVIVLNERHLNKLLSEYVRYYHEDRTHLGLAKGTPDGRIRSVASGRILSQERLGGLHHRYNRAA